MPPCCRIVISASSPKHQGACWAVLLCGCDCLRADVLEWFCRVPMGLCRAPCCCHWWKSSSVVWCRGTTWTHVLPFPRKAVSLSSTSQKIISFSPLAALIQISLTLLAQKIQLCCWEEFENERLVPIFFFLINHLGGFFFSSWDSFFRVKAGSSQRELAPQTRLPTDVVRLCWVPVQLARWFLLECPRSSHDIHPNLQCSLFRVHWSQKVELTLLRL